MKCKVCDEECVEKDNYWYCNVKPFKDGRMGHYQRVTYDLKIVDYFMLDPYQIQSVYSLNGELIDVFAFYDNGRDQRMEKLDI
jgi:hypothetical protein